jgi:hypothetical protein
VGGQIQQASNSIATGGLTSRNAADNTSWDSNVADAHFLLPSMPITASVVTSNHGITVKQCLSTLPARRMFMKDGGRIASPPILTFTAVAAESLA